MSTDTITKSLEPIQPDAIGVSSAIPSPQIEAIPKKVLYLLYHLSYHQLIPSS